MTALEALGLDGNATWADVQRNYRALAKKAHPDFSGDSGEAMSTLDGYHQQLRAAQSYGLFDDAEAQSNP